jgi:hypothetical protein
LVRPARHSVACLSFEGAETYFLTSSRTIVA